MELGTDIYAKVVHTDSGTWKRDTLIWSIHRDQVRYAKWVLSKPFVLVLVDIPGGVWKVQSTNMHLHSHVFVATIQHWCLNKLIKEMHIKYRVLWNVTKEIPLYRLRCLYQRYQWKRLSNITRSSLFLKYSFVGNFTEDLFYNIMFFTNPTENKVLETFAPKYIWMYFFCVHLSFQLNKQL